MLKTQCQQGVCSLSQDNRFHESCYFYLSCSLCDLLSNKLMDRMGLDLVFVLV